MIRVMSSSISTCTDVVPAASEHLCYTHCNFCNIVLAVSVPGRSLFNTINVKCGNCTSMWPVNVVMAADLHQSLTASSSSSPRHKQGPNHIVLNYKTDLGFSEHINAQEINNLPQEKRRGLPSLNNRFIGNQQTKEKSEIDERSSWGGKCGGRRQGDDGVLITSDCQQPHTSPLRLSRYELQKLRDWNTFGHYLTNEQRPPVALSHCTYSHVLDFLRYLDQFGKTKVHLRGCVFFGHRHPVGECTCPLRQAWGSLDALIGRLRAAYKQNGGLPEMNPFASGAVGVYLREIRCSQAKARGISYKNKKKKRNIHLIKANEETMRFHKQQ